VSAVVSGRLSPSIMIGAVDAPDAATGSLSLEELYRSEARRLLGMLCVLLGDRSEAEDVLQEAFARVHRSWDRIQDRDRAAAYLRSTAFNLARSTWRRRRRRSGTIDRRQSDEAHSSSVVDVVVDGLMLREDQRAVLAALRTLPDRQRACVVLRFYGGAGIDEIGATLGIAPNSVKTHLQRAMSHLRSELEATR
jgi:RNA polymerase sigma-70 factor (sigma-E family)